VSEKAIPGEADDPGDPDGAGANGVAARIAARTLAKRGPDYTTEVRRLLDAALAVIAEHGTTARARVADVVAAAGLSNDAFYRHFPSKDALVAALIEDGTLRLASYVAHQMDKEASPDGKVRRWVEGVLSQTDGETAATTLAVLWNGSSFNSGMTPASHNASVPLAALLHGPFTALGSAAPVLDASLVAHATLGKVSEHLLGGTRPSPDELDHIVRFCIDAAAARPARR
jgi:AcrR family transcriptional regulator